MKLCSCTSIHFTTWCYLNTTGWEIVTTIVQQTVYNSKTIPWSVRVRDRVREVSTCTCMFAVGLVGAGHTVISVYAMQPSLTCACTLLGQIWEG